MRRTFVAVAAALACTVPSAHAATIDAVTITGSGGFAPGLGALPAAEAVWFAGSATVLGTSGVAVVFPCQWAGTSVESIAGGVGAVAGNCGPVPLRSCTYVRAGTQFDMTCVGPLLSAAHFTGVFTPANLLPTTAYSLALTGEWIV
jgi:hypothetical protein